MKVLMILALSAISSVASATMCKTGDRVVVGPVTGETVEGCCDLSVSMNGASADCPIEKTQFLGCKDSKGNQYGYGERILHVKKTYDRVPTGAKVCPTSGMMMHSAG